MRKREGGRMRGRVGVPAPGTGASPAEERKRERTESKSEDTNHSRVTDLRRLTDRGHPQLRMQKSLGHKTKNDVREMSR